MRGEGCSHGLRGSVCLTDQSVSRCHSWHATGGGALSTLPQVLSPFILRHGHQQSPEFQEHVPEPLFQHQSSISWHPSSPKNMFTTNAPAEKAQSHALTSQRSLKAQDVTLALTQTLAAAAAECHRQPARASALVSATGQDGVTNHGPALAPNGAARAELPATTEAEGPAGLGSLGPRRAALGHGLSENKCAQEGKEKVPVKSPSTTQATSAKCRQLVEATLAATGRMSPMWVHSRAVYFFSREPTPISSGPGGESEALLVFPGTWGVTATDNNVLRQERVGRVQLAGLRQAPCGWTPCETGLPRASASASVDTQAMTSER